MNYQQSFAISSAGMNVERLRVEVAALNLANAHTVATTGGKLYQPLKVVASAPGQLMASSGFAGMLNLDGPTALVEASDNTPRRVLDPGHPLADDKGFVMQPGVDPAAEMMTIMSALRSYEANVAAMNAARAMALKSLDIGGAS
jgi:flagellar basal-body rod protein FlgC